MWFLHAPSSEESERRREDGDFRRYGEIVVNGPHVDRMSKDEYECDYEDNTDAEAHMEYRTPPSWLFHPKIAMLSLQVRSWPRLIRLAQSRS